jgi:hypothetical protein
MAKRLVVLYYVSILDKIGGPTYGGWRWREGGKGERESENKSFISPECFARTTQEASLAVRFS